MRILIIGGIVFTGWAIFSTYIYVCKMKGLCPQTTQTTLVAMEASDNRMTANQAKQTTAEQVVIPTDLIINFAFDKSDFTPGARAEAYFGASNALLKSNQQAMLSITGHTDSIGTREYNQALGIRRAQTMHRYFVSMGIPASRMNITSKGEEAPVANNNTKEGRAKNRRSVVTIKP